MVVEQEVTQVVVLNEFVEADAPAYWSVGCDDAKGRRGECGRNAGAKKGIEAERTFEMDFPQNLFAVKEIAADSSATSADWRERKLEMTGEQFI